MQTRRDTDKQAYTQHSGRMQRQHGKIGWLVLWLIGIPVPLLIILFLIRGCT